MKPHLVEKLVSLMTQPKSPHRNGHPSGECRVAGSTFALGTFEVMVGYDGTEMHCSGHCGLQHMSIKQDEKDITIRVVRRKGAFIKNDVKLALGDYDGLLEWYRKWFLEVAMENAAPTPANYR